MNHPTRPERITLELERFLPYRVSQIARAFATALTGALGRRFELTLSEWRVLMVLALHPGSSAAQVAQLTGLDKVAVSRAVGSLMNARRLERTPEESDRRRANLRLTPRGEALYDDVVAWCLAYERALLRGMPTRNRQKLDALLDAVLERARNVRADRVVAKRP